MRMLDLFCGRGGWTNAFLQKGWSVTGVDLRRHPDYQGEFVEANVLRLAPEFIQGFDFVCASSPCEEFSVHGLKHFFPNPKFPDMGLVLFCWTRRMLDNAGVKYVMENVRSAQAFVGVASHHCGPFYLWGNGVPVLMHQGISKGWGRKWTDSKGRIRDQGPTGRAGKDKEWKLAKDGTLTAKVATIPPELANCVADYAQRLLEQECHV